MNVKLRKAIGERHLLSGLRLRIPVLSTFVLLGIVAGQIAGHCVSAEHLNEIGMCLSDYAVTQVSTWRLFAVYLQWPFMALLLGYCTLGVGLLPLLCGAEGFALSFAVSCFCAILGRHGILLALAALGIRALILLPCGLITSDWAFSRVCRMASGEKIAHTVPLRLLVCAALLALGIGLEYLLSPGWIASALMI